MASLQVHRVILKAETTPRLRCCPDFGRLERDHFKSSRPCKKSTTKQTNATTSETMGLVRSLRQFGFIIPVRMRMCLYHGLVKWGKIRTPIYIWERIWLPYRAGEPLRCKKMMNFTITHRYQNETKLNLRFSGSQTRVKWFKPTSSSGTGHVKDFEVHVHVDVSRDFLHAYYIADEH